MTPLSLQLQRKSWINKISNLNVNLSLEPINGEVRRFTQTRYALKLKVIKAFVLGIQNLYYLII